MTGGTLPGGDPVRAFIVGIPLIAAVGVLIWILVALMAVWERRARRGGLLQSRGLHDRHPT
jgi:hypothetical protein